MIANHHESSSFGTLLKMFRTRRHLTQRQLAEAIGMHRHAIGRWEQGDVLPASGAVVLELARCLRLDELEARQLLEASLTALSPHWQVPFSRNPFFTGREKSLEALHRHLKADQAALPTRMYALHGLAGVGKTQIALEYVYQHALEYTAVFWFGAETSEQILASMRSIAELLALPERGEKDSQRVVASVQSWLSTHSRWLLIWDNLEDLNLLHHFLPSIHAGVILITTRYQVLGTLARGIHLLPMEQEEGMLFLLRRSKVLEADASREQVQQFAHQAPSQYRAAAAVVQAMGGLPLALDQAGAYIEESQCGFVTYLRLLRARRASLLQQRGMGLQDHPASVSATLRLAIMATARRHPAAWAFLRICALLQPDAIPEEFFFQGAAHFGPPLETICRDELAWNRVMAIACSYSLVYRQPEEQTLSLHRLVQAVLLDTMTRTEREKWIRRVIGALDSVFPEVRPLTEYASWKQGERLLLHALLCLSRVGVADESLALASLAYKVALYLREQQLGQHHPETAETLHNLALFWQKQENWSEALSCAERALHIRSQTLGDTHPQTSATRALHSQLLQAQAREEVQQVDMSERPASAEPSSSPTIKVAVHGVTGQVAYTRQVSMREITFTCAICGRTVTQWHYPSGKIKYCSEECRAVRSAQRQQERVARQREKRRAARAAQQRNP